MGLNLFINGGELRIEKRQFIREIFSPNSLLRSLLNYNLEDQGKSRSLTVDKSNTETVIISFNFVDQVCVSEDYHRLLENLKKELKDKIKGKISLIVDGGYEYYNLTLDFNADSGSISQY